MVHPERGELSITDIAVSDAHDACHHQHDIESILVAGAQRQLASDRDAPEMAADARRILTELPAHVVLRPRASSSAGRAVDF